jgi:hypothetical protein
VAGEGEEGVGSRAYFEDPDGNFSGVLQPSAHSQ